MMYDSMGGEVEGWENPLLASAPPPLSLCTALERVVAGFKLLLFVGFVFVLYLFLR